MSLKYNMTREEIESSGTLGATKINLAKILNSFYLKTNSEELSVGQWLSNHGYWESWITSWMTKNIYPGYTCIDIGANYGYYTRVMEILSTEIGSVHAFEANKDLCSFISQSVSEHPVNNAAKIVIHDIAVSDHKGTATLSIPPKYIGGSSIVRGKEELPSNIDDDMWSESMQVNSDTLDNLLKNVNHINLIKIDIEGAEYLAWLGMQEVLAKTDLVIIELGSYSKNELKDDIYKKYNVSYIDFDGNEKLISRDEMDNLDDLIMAVLRKK
jgi:FkbM family methyltransferase